MKFISSDDTEQAIISGECAVALVFDGQVGCAFVANPYTCPIDVGEAATVCDEYWTMLLPEQ